MIFNEIFYKHTSDKSNGKKGYILICPSCGEKFYKKNSIVENALRDKKLKAFFCSVDCKNSKKGQEVYKKQLKENFGVENNFQKESSKIKSKETCLKKYGKEFACQSEYVKNKIIEGNIKNHGYSHPQKNPEIKKRTIETVKDKYVDLIGCMPRKQTEKTNIDKYGAKTFFSSEKGRMTDENLRNNYGWSDEDLEIRKRKQVLAPRKNGKTSSLNKMFADFLRYNNISFEEELEIKTKNKMYFYDFKVNNWIIEINGDYWHANPRKYKENDIFYMSNSKMIARDIWEKDFKKIEVAKNEGCEILVFWELEMKEDGFFERFLFML